MIYINSVLYDNRTARQSIFTITYGWKLNVLNNTIGVVLLYTWNSNLTYKIECVLYRFVLLYTRNMLYIHEVLSSLLIAAAICMIWRICEYLQRTNTDTSPVGAFFTEGTAIIRKCLRIDIETYLIPKKKRSSEVIVRWEGKVTAKRPLIKYIQ